MGRVTSKGQVTIPVAIREQLGLLPGTEVRFEVQDGVAQIRRADDEPEDGRGRRIVRRLQGRATVELSTDEILALTRPD